MDKSNMLDTATSRRIGDYDCPAISRISDYNSNTYEKDDTTNRYNVEDRNLSYISSIISQDADFIQDSSDYQWFADYSLRGDNNSICSNMHTSILSSLCTSYGYNDMARDLDANLAQVDMEDFRSEDIHSFLHSLPQLCGTDVQNERGGEMYASISGSLMMKYDFDSSLSARSTSQEDSTGSIYKSEILFSPVREVPLVSFSIDSLDCGEHDIMLTCQANKDNYTIAFEGSTLMEKSTDSHYPPANENIPNVGENRHVESVERMSLDTTSSENSNSANTVEKNFINKSPLICSESPYTTWSKLKGDSAENILKRQSSGNNNTNAFSSSTGYADLTASCAFLKSQSLPNLNPVKRQFLLSRRMNNSMRQGQLEEQPSSTNKFVKIYNLSRSQCGRKIHRSVFQNNVNFDLISQFINHKHVVNAYRGDEHQNVNALSSKFSKTVDNLNQSSVSSTLARVDEVNNGEDYAPENKGCDVFQDSLVSNRNMVDKSVDVLAMSDSCSSFSSHSGRVDVTKKVDSWQDKNDFGVFSSEKEHTSSFLRNKYCAKNFEREIKKRKLVKKCLNNPKPIKIMDRSMQTSSSDADSAVSPTSQQKNSNSNVNKPVYVMYPNYTLPDLSFLEQHATELDLQNVFLWPQKFSPSPTTEHASAFSHKEERKKVTKKRPCSCPDLESIKNKDYQHIRDWESLMFLLPREYCKILTEDPALQKYAENLDDFGRSLICTSTLSEHEQVVSEIKTGGGSTCSTGTQPSSGYRGSSTMCSTDSGVSAAKYEDHKAYCNRPPLPKGILRNPGLQNIKSKKNMMNTKRYSMFEWREDLKTNPEKRRSLPSQFSNNAPKKLCDKETSYSEDEGVDSSGSHCDSPGPHSDQDAKRLEHLLQTVFQWSDTDATQLRNQNSKKTVSFADRHNRTPPNSPNCSVSAQQKTPYQLKLYSAFDSAIHEECEAEKHGYCEHMTEPRTNSYNFKRELIDSVEEATKCIIGAGDNEETMAQIALNHLCPALYAVLNHGLKSNLETAFGDIGNSVWQVVEASSQQGLMTRALHELVLRLNNEDVLTEGLLKFNAFVFGLLNVRGLDAWFSYLRTRESVLRKHYTDTGILLSSCRGIMSDRQLTDHLLNSLKPLSDLTFKLDLLYECRQLHNSLMQLGQNSPVQSNSTRTSWVLKKIVRSLQNVTGNPKEREDYEENNSVPRPRSCVDSSSGFNLNDIASTVKRRWSGIQFGSKLASAFERLAAEEDETYTDSLDHAVNRKDEDESINDMASSNTDDNDLSITHNEIYDPDRENDEQELPIRELKFKQLQKKWETLVEKQSPENVFSKDSFSSRNMEDSSSTMSNVKSRIPRLVTSPVRPPTGLNFSILPTGRANSQLKQASPTSPSSIPTAISRKATSPIGLKRIGEQESSRITKSKNSNNRPNRVDANTAPSSHVARPNSLPQKTSRLHQRRIVDDQKRPSSSSRFMSVASKYVRTLGHRLPSDTGHLSYNEGEKLRVVLEVDDKWILCCRGDQKGLVPRAAVLAISGHL